MTAKELAIELNDWDTSEGMEWGKAQDAKAAGSGGTSPRP